MPKPERFLLSYSMNVGDLGESPDLRELFVFAALLQSHLEFDGAIEVVLHRLLAPAGDDEDVADPGTHRLLNRVLDAGHVDNRDHLFGNRLAGGKEPRSQSRSRNYRLLDWHDGDLLGSISRFRS